MSFGYAVGDVIAILCLFERIAIELRNYKGAPMHFQRLYVELDLMHSTLKHVMVLEPGSPTEHQTMEKVRAIVMHCKQPLQSMAEKMRAKESSLGHFKTTRSLSSIGTRLHWSMIAQGDVEELRKTILSQMAAINILLSVQQMNRIEHIALQSRNIGTSQSLMLEKHANAIAGHASNILTITSRTQSAIDILAVDANTNAEAQSKQANMINKDLNAIEKTMLGLAQKSENTTGMVRRQTAFLGRHVNILFRVMQNLKDIFKLHMLLDITAQLKHIIRAIEAIPLHLTLDIVRLDDAHGESWALPLQSCTTWESFNEMLRFVVYANNRPGADYITHNLFDVSNAKTGKHIDQNTWAMVRCLQSMEPIQNMDDAIRLLSQSRDSLDCLNCAVRLNSYFLEHRYNVSDLYDFCNHPSDAVDAFMRCLELSPGLLVVQTPVDAQKAYIENDDLHPLGDSLIGDMIEAPLSDQYSKVYPVPASTDHITLDPVRQDAWEDNNADEESLSDDDYTD
ncbi:hypothetical protein FCIRC_8518 [Fusarium circinatum]|uniref:Ubiquitin-like domain-containing protein n=1 Tax=Fusarium circinatum TaxID=48490 RepID=A0A8H5TH46_FUSCI|nr:hypothetical protein FCIRC_8518 [Fusarium circinatum]